MNLSYKIFITLLAVSLLSATPQAMAQQKQKQGVPTLNANAKKYTEKKHESSKPVRPGQYTSSPKQEVLVGFRSTSFWLNKQTATVALAPSMEFKNNPATNGSATMTIFQTSSAQGPQTVNSSSWSGGNAAEGLMTSGSHYSSAATDGGGSTTVGSVSTPAGPRKGFADPDPDPFPDPEVPVGNVLGPLALMALAYCGFLICKKRKAQD